MAIRKSVEESFVSAGTVEDWLARSEAALSRAGFKKIKIDAALGQVRGDYKQWVGTLWGDLLVSLSPAVGRNVQVHLHATANVDNIYALGRSPGQKLIDKFKAELGEVLPAEQQVSDTDGGSLSAELQRLGDLRATGVLDDAEFAEAKKKLLS
jgi:Short C-terminal domain